MASQFLCSSGSFATSTSAKTAAAVIAGGTVSPTLIGFDLSSDGTVTSGSFIVELVSYSQATAGTAGGSTVVKMGATQASASSTCGTAYSAEPTVATVLCSWLVPAAGGPFSYLWPLGREVQVPTGKTYGIRVTAPSGTPAVRANLIWEE